MGSTLCGLLVLYAIGSFYTFIWGLLDGLYAGTFRLKLGHIVFFAYLVGRSIGVLMGIPIGRERNR